MIDLELQHEIFKHIPTPTLILKADNPNYTIVLANKAYLNATIAKESDLIGSNLFDAFPQNPHDTSFAEGVIKLRKSLDAVITNKKENIVPAQRYDIPISGTDKFEIRYWEPINTPILNNEGEVEYIIHSVIDITERITTALNLKNSERRYQELVYSMDAVLWESDANTFHNLYISPQVTQILGYNREEWSQPGFWEKHVHPDDIQEVLKHSSAQIAKRENYFLEYRMIAADNSIVWISDKISVITSEDQPTLLRGIMIDITGRKKAEQVALENEVKLNKILDRSLDIVCSIDENGHFNEINSASHRIWGYKPAELIGKPYIELVHEEDKEISLQTAQSLRKGSNTTTFQNRFISKSGKSVPMWWSANWEEEEKLIFCVGKDATEIQEAEKSLSYSEQRFKSLVQYGADFIAIINQEGIYNYCSLNSENILGYRADELVGKNAFTFIHEQDLEKVTVIFDKLLQGKNIISETFRYRTKSGNYLWMETIAIDMRDNPAVNGIVVNSRDVTEKKHYLEWHELVNKAAHIAIYDYDINGKKINWGGNAPDLFSSTKDKSLALLTNWEERLHPDDKIRVLDSLRDALKSPTQSKWKEEFRFLDLSNKYLFLGLEGYFIRESNGYAYRMIGAVRDISERKLYEQNLRENNLRFELATNATSDAIWDWDLAKDTVHRGIGYQNLFGYRLGKKLLKSEWWKDKIHPQDKKKVIRALKHFIAGAHNKWEQEYRFRKSNGEYKYVYDRGFALRNDSGKVVRIVGAMQDIHHEKIKEIEDSLKLTIGKIFTVEKSLQVSFKKSLRAIIMKTDYDYGEIWTTNIEQSEISLKAHFGKAKYTLTDEKINFQLEEGLPGHIWKKMEPIFIDDLSNDKLFLRKEFAEINELQCIDGYPIIYQDEVKAVMLLYCKKGTEKIIQNLINQDILNLLGTEIQRKKSEQELDFFFELSPDLMCINDLNANYVKVNQAFTSLLGYDKDEVLNTFFLDYIHPEDYKIFDDISSKIQSGLVMDHESRFKAKSGNYVWISWTAKPFPAEGMILAVGKDITEKKKQEEALAASNKSLSTTLESIQDGFIAMNKDWTINYWNKEAENIIKIQREKVIGKYFWEAFPEAMKGKFFQEYNRCSKDQVTVRFEEYFSPIDAWLGVTAYPSESGITVYFKDITDNKNASLKLLQFKNVIENSKDEIAIISTVNDSLYLNPAYTEAFGYGIEKLKQVGGPQIVFINENQAAEVFSELLAGKYWKGDVELLSTNRKIKSYYISAGPIFNDDHKLIAVYIIHTDVSSRKEIESKVKELYLNLKHQAKELANAKEELNHFAHIASSNLKEPLQFLSENLKHLKQRYSHVIDETGSDNLQTALKTSDYMAFVLSELVNYSLMDQVDINYEKVDLNEVLKEISSGLREQILDKFAKLEIPKLPVIKGYKPHFIEIFKNLISNGLTFQEDHPIIRIDFSSNKTHWLFSVSDNGIGIDSSDFDKIFNLFETLNYHNGYAGSGMGLAVTKKLVEKYGGKIWVESKPQKGSIFYFTISKDI